jgi:hypothetical protein
MGGACCTYGRNEMRTKFWSGSLKRIDHLEDVGTDGRIILEWILQKCGRNLLTGFIWLRIGTSGGLRLSRIYGPITAH